MNLNIITLKDNMILTGPVCEECGDEKNIFMNVFQFPLHVIIYYTMEKDVPLHKILGCSCSSDFEHTDSSVIKNINNQLIILNYLMNLDLTPPSPKSPFDFLD